MVIVNFSKNTCHWCGGPLAFKCTCGYYSCVDCLRFPNEFGCVHEKQTEIESDDWVIYEAFNESSK